MRCQIIRDDLEVSCASPEVMEGQIEVKQVVRNHQRVERTFWKKGAIISHPDAFRLVKQGVAIAHDEECRQAANMTSEGMKAAQHAYGRLAAGIHPDDFSAYDAGYLSGYTSEGEWKPGPNGGRDDYIKAFGLEDTDEDDDE